MSYLLTGLRLGMILVSLEHRLAGVRWQVSWGTSWVSWNLKFNANINTILWGEMWVRKSPFLWRPCRWGPPASAGTFRGRKPRSEIVFQKYLAQIHIFPGNSISKPPQSCIEWRAKGRTTAASDFCLRHLPVDKSSWAALRTWSWNSHRCCCCSRLPPSLNKVSPEWSCRTRVSIFLLVFFSRNLCQQSWMKCLLRLLGTWCHKLKRNCI